MNADSRARFTASIALLTGVLFVGCDDGPSAPSTPNISGSWRGTYRTGVGSNFDPCDTNGPAAAVFTQNDRHVEGTLSTERPSAAEGAFVGDFVAGDQLRGTLTNGSTMRNIGGTATEDRIVLSIDLPGCSSNSFELHR